VPFVYTSPADPTAARDLLHQVDVELEALREQQVKTPFGVLSASWNGEKLAISGELKCTGGRRTWSFLFRPNGPVTAT
jgi:hypothetical protein